MNKLAHTLPSTFFLIPAFMVLGGCSEAPDVKHFDPPAKTHFQIHSTIPSDPLDDISASGTGFRTLHGGSHNADEVSIALSPMFEPAWTAEDQFWIYEGPSFDDSQQLYFSPIKPKESVNLLALSAESGERLWTIEGSEIGQGGAPLVLNNPGISDNPNNLPQQTIYTGSYESIKAISQSGQVLWNQPTGLTIDSTLNLGERHNYGVNYLSHHDALVTVVGTGKVIVLNREDGSPLLDTPYALPGVSPYPKDAFPLPEFVRKATRPLWGHFFEGEASAENDTLKEVTGMVMGNSASVANFFAISKANGRIWIAATAPDDEDGTIDGYSSLGALYGLDLIKNTQGEHSLEIVCSISFDGGSASSPALNADGSRIYVADNFGKLFAIDQDSCNTLWSYDVGRQIVGSAAVAKDNGELFLSTTESVIKLIDQGDSAELVWTASPDIFDLNARQETRNTNLVAIGANGIFVQVGAGFVLQNELLPQSIGIAMMDRETGELRFASPAVEETLSVMSVSTEGELFIANSPLRRVLSKTLTGNKTPGITGGITRYQSIDANLLLRESSCAAADLAHYLIEAQLTIPNDKMLTEKVRLQQRIDQSIAAGNKAISEQTLSASDWSIYFPLLSAANAALEIDDFSGSFSNLNQVCNTYE